MPRPGGNPDIAKYGFKPKHDWAEPCNERMQIRMPASMKAAIKDGLVKDWQEVARRAIAEEIEKAQSPQVKN
ncbi:MAG: hypothetical protein AB4038_11335 [Prochloraceae cyanobacterium]